jgi:DNA-binding CsgD family transcriptional regulator
VAGPIVGRDSELATIEESLSARANGLQVLLIEGEPGIGKTTIWQAGIDRAAELGYHVLSCQAAQAEIRMSFAGLGDLFADVEPDAIASLPPPQRLAIDRALLRAEAGPRPPPPQAIGVGVVGVMAALGRQGPVLIAIDDVQWLDRPTVTTLAFAFRRLEAQPVVVLATVRAGDPHGWSESFDRVPSELLRRLWLGPLSLGALYEILRPRFGKVLTRPVLGSIESASRGNPFYAIELARAIEAESPRSGIGLPIPADTRELHARRLRRLPRRTRDELLKASAQVLPTIETVDADMLQPAADAEIVRIHPDGRVEFAHPLFATAVYGAAPEAERRRIHRELASISRGIEEQARHLSLASDGHGRELADLLDRASEHALARGAPEVAADLAEQAARRTPDASPDLVWDRLLRASRHSLKAGDPVRARALGEEVAYAVPSGPVRARALYLLAEERVMEGPASAIKLLEEAIATVDSDVALEADLETSMGWMLVAAFQLQSADEHLTRAAELADRVGEQDLLSQALAVRELASLLLGRGVNDDAIERALALEAPDHEVPFQRRPSLIRALVFNYIGRLERAQVLLAALREQLLARGDEGDLAHVLVHQGVTSLLAGDLAGAEEHVGHAMRIATLTGQDLLYAFALALRAVLQVIRGDPGRARADATEALERSDRLGWQHGVNQSRYALAMVAMAEENPSAAVTWLDPVIAQVEAVGIYEWVIAMSIPDAIEALIAIGDTTRAARLIEGLEALGRKHDRPWALALSGRSRAILSAAAGDLAQAQAAAEGAVIEHERLPMPLELGRTLFVLGQLQRRRGQRRAARETLRRAETTFEGIGARLWADRTRAEAQRIGVRRTPVELTTNERVIAELAASGLTNREIAARTFMSRRTVEANLSRAYGKLGVRSRTELARSFPVPRLPTPRVPAPPDPGSIHVEMTDARPNHTCLGSPSSRRDRKADPAEA